MQGQVGFWDVDERYAQLSEAGDPLEKLNSVVPWDVFRKPLAKALKRSDGAKGGRPPYDAVMMFKVLVLQALYDLSDDQAEFVINDRLSFMRFLGLSMGDKVPGSDAHHVSDDEHSHDQFGVDRGPAEVTVEGAQLLRHPIDVKETVNLAKHVIGRYMLIKIEVIE